MKAKTPDLGETPAGDYDRGETPEDECGETAKYGRDEIPGCGSGETLFREKVERIVNERIRPALNLHDGDISIQDVRGGEIWVVFAGACRGCPSAQITLEEVVGQIFGEELGSEFKAVHLVNNVDEDLLNFARHLLDKNKK